MLNRVGLIYPSVLLLRFMQKRYCRLLAQAIDRFADLRQRFTEARQAHVFQWYDEGKLSLEQADSL